MVGNQDSLITVGVPIYNVSEYLSECLDSILNQTYNNLEIILVDDGSTDNSGEISDKYAELDQRIQVIHKKNQGLAAARNTATAVATGDYIVFVDSDDCVSERYIATLYHLINSYEADMACIKSRSFVVLSDIKLRQEVPQLKVYESDDIIKNSINIQNATWGKIYKIHIIKDNPTFVNPFNQTGEDNILATELLKVYSKVVISNEVLYYHRENPTSIMSANRKSFPVVQLFSGNRFVGNRAFVDWCGKYKPDLLNFAIARLAYTMCGEYNIFVSIESSILDYKVYKKYLNRLILGNLVSLMSMKEISFKVKLWLVSSALFPRWLYKIFKRRFESR